MEGEEVRQAKRQKMDADHDADSEYVLGHNEQQSKPPMADIVLENAIVSVQEDWLCDNSAFFKACIRGGWKESLTKTVHIEDVDAHVFLLLVDVTETMLGLPETNTRHNYNKACDQVIALLPDTQQFTTFAQLVRLADFLLMNDLHCFLRRV